MNIWLLLLSVYPYCCFTIFLMGFIWRYDKQYIQQSITKLETICYYTLRILFIAFLLLLVSSRMLSLHPVGFPFPIKEILTFQFNYNFVLNLSIPTKFYVIIISSLLMLFAFTPLPKLGLCSKNTYNN